MFLEKLAKYAGNKFVDISNKKNPDLQAIVRKKMYLCLKF